MLAHPWDRVTVPEVLARRSFDRMLQCFPGSDLPKNRAVLLYGMSCEIDDRYGRSRASYAPALPEPEFWFQTYTREAEIVVQRDLSKHMRSKNVTSTSALKT
jgi:hypothetical protein